MAGNRTGGLKAAAKNKAYFGEDYYQRIGRHGGQANGPKGFGSKKVGSDGLTGQERARAAGAVGGKISRRKGRA